MSDEVTAKLRDAVYPRCSPSTRTCEVCWYGRECGPFYGIQRLDIDHERPCPCACHREVALAAYGDRRAAVARAEMPCYRAAMVGGQRPFACHDDERCPSCAAKYEAEKKLEAGH